MSAIGLERRLANFRAARIATPVIELEAAIRRNRVSRDAAERLAAAVGGEVVAAPGGRYVRIDGPPLDLAVDRDRLADLPDQPPAGVELVCLDIETTGLATAAGTIAFLVGIGRWSGSELRTVQLLLPDHADEAAVLSALAELIPPDAWLVTYNGRGFDWPLLVARYRMHLRAAPDHAGHLDLLPLVRRIFRHRLPDARLRTVESDLLEVSRHHDVDGWEIPGRYLDVLRGGPAELLADVVTHNAEDVRSLGRLVSHLARCFGDRTTWRSAPAGDLAGLGRAFRLSGRLAEALECLDLALAAPPMIRPLLAQVPHAVRETPAEAEWWTGPVDFPWQTPRRPVIEPIRVGDAWTEQRVLVERAHLLRRLGRHAEAELAWVSAAAGPGRISALAWVEVAKLRERRLGDLDGAIAATERARAATERRRRLGLPEPRLELAIGSRMARLVRRRDRQASGAARLQQPA
jgi:uncharacterized protein YprB with RNaseH-like and TPR domain